MIRLLVIYFSHLLPRVFLARTNKAAKHTEGNILHSGHDSTDSGIKKNYLHFIT